MDAERAEEQELEKGGLADTLKVIVGHTMPCPRYVRFHEAHVQRYLSRLKAFPPRCGGAPSLHLMSGFRMRNKTTSCCTLMIGLSMLGREVSSAWRQAPSLLYSQVVPTSCQVSLLCK